MAKCNIAIHIGNVKNRKELMEKAQAAITHHGGKLVGDEAAGTFELPILIGHINGNYTISEHTFSLEITHKPLLVSCKRIEDELTKYLNE